MREDERSRKGSGEIRGIVAAFLMRLQGRPVYLILCATVVLAATPAFPGALIVAGNGPELLTIERLARAFEKAHLGSVVDVQWDGSSRPIDRVKSGEADFAVAAQPDQALAAVPIAWDGIAVVVYIANPTRAMSMQQVAAVFSGKVTRWTELGPPGAAIQLIDRPANQNIRQGFEEVLGIVGQISPSARVIGSDEGTMSAVAGNRSSVAYASLRPALDAVKYGVDVSLLQIDQVEAAEETVKDGRYKLRRPVLLLSRQDTTPVAAAFVAFALSAEGQQIIGETYAPYR